MAQTQFKGLFITGTDTGVGKTYVAARIAAALRDQNRRVGLYKPACSGAARGDDGDPVWHDVESLCGALGHEFPSTRVCPQCFAAPLAPPAAAAAEGSVVDRNLLRNGALWWRDQVELLIVEGAGGLLSPISERDTVAELAGDLGFPLVVVAANRLGMINQTLLTLEAAHARGLPVAGVILNHPTPGAGDPSLPTNVEWLARFSTAPILGTLEHGAAGLLRPGGGSDRMDWADVASRAAGPAPRS